MIEPYSSEKHSEYLDGFTDYVNDLSEGFEEFSDVIEEAMAEGSEVFEVPDDVKIVVAQTDVEAMREEHGKDFSRVYLVHGYSFHSGMENAVEDEDVILLRSGKGLDEWRAAMKNMLVHELAHQRFFRDSVNFSFEEQYDDIFFEGHAMLAAEKVCKEFSWRWRPPFRPEETIKLNLEDFIQDLQRKRVLDDTDGEEIGSLFRSGGERFQNAEGYPASFQICRWLVRNTDLEFDKIPKLEKDRRKRLAERAAEELFN